MKRSETAALLAKIAAVDNRRLDPPDADVTNPMATPILSSWHELVGELNYSDCLEAVRRHRVTSRDWLQPIDVISRVKDIRRERLDRAPDEGTLMAGVDPGDPRWTLIYRERRRAIADGSPMVAIAGGAS